MKNIKIYTIIGVFLMSCTLLTACDTDFENPNNPTEDVVLGTKDGLFALATGIRQYYSVFALRQIIEAPGITTRELGVTNTFLNINELAKGGAELPAESGGITNPWVNVLRAKGMAESLIAGANAVELTEGTKSGLLAYGNLFKAMSLGYLIDMFEEVPINNALDGAAPFSDRASVLAECISLLTNARDGMLVPISDEFQSTVLWADFSLMKTVNAFLARYHLIAGNYNEAIAAANAVINSSDITTSMWVYDANNQNPIWNRTVNSADLNPQTNFGLLGNYIPEAGDGRIDFYLGADAGSANADAGGQPLSEMLGFFSTNTSPIPIYLPGEMLLIKAEAYARLDQLNEAVTALNLVRQKNNDPLGVNANLLAWAGDATNKNAVLEEIYKNRCIELFLTGLRFGDSKRFHPDFAVPSAANTTNERNRNYYPYPSIERENNPNTPADPLI
ncbi:RagB/SusD family nutrient uptake outer membrane protein [Oceanihabitans sp. IOP_32]|uniref:RagB/SusD family nutrient uptake outer membrane protein n=1 Tax=Oceanihabitans sp. IOP_32 TaxID=2529032 RepID=UPI0012940F7C|nr:RagB/SusD family nutrient uptake outer membrane protein [Oceanihabitans sp. IOP_32]QFZ55287.1 RagB/SusD family nutrient uptake outer membrane protein [Oceanihabitans sp. IOP_32]